MAEGWHIVAPHLLSIVGFVMALLLGADVLRDRRAPGTTFAWLLVIAPAPYVGVPLYLVFGERKLKRMVDGATRRVEIATLILAGDEVGEALGKDSGALAPAGRAHAFVESVARLVGLLA